MHSFHHGTLPRALVALATSIWAVPLFAACGDDGAGTSSSAVRTAASTVSATTASTTTTAATVASTLGTTTARVTTAPTATTEYPATAFGIASDEPCTAHDAATAALAPAQVSLDDLARMVLTREDVGGLPGFDVHPFNSGYVDNGWFSGFEVQPPDTCQDLVHYGRISGYSAAYFTSEVPARALKFAVHLFWDAASARAWTEHYFDGLAQVARDSDGQASIIVTPATEFGDGGLMVEHIGTDGNRTWAVFQRGPIVGWIVDLHAGSDPTIDVGAAATVMADRMETVMSETATTGPMGLDAVRFMSVPLPLAAYGDTAAGLTWDEGFGGCMDVAELASLSGTPVPAGPPPFGQGASCTAMYSAAAPVDVVRVFSRITLYDTDTDTDSGAGAAFADAVRQRLDQGFEQFELSTTAIGDEATGLRGLAEDEHIWRGVIRSGPYLLTVQISDRSTTDRAEEIGGLAEQLVARLTRLLPTAEEELALWPEASAVFTTPEAAAEDFVRTVLDIPPLLGEFRPGDSRSGEIDVLAPASGSGAPRVVRSILLMRQLGPELGWHVLAAVNPELRVSSPRAGADIIPGPLVVTGSARGFDDTVQVSVFSMCQGGRAYFDRQSTEVAGAGGPTTFTLTLDMSVAEAHRGTMVILLARRIMPAGDDPGSFTAIALRIPDLANGLRAGAPALAC